jgi:adenosylcobinamide kinase/adenosylcobinamide-phosphate guanylyltransferase
MDNLQPLGTTTPDGASSLILIAGGAHSGKSQTARDMARMHNGTALVLASANHSDPPPPKQQADSPLSIPAPPDLAASILENGSRYGVLLIDCLTEWLQSIIAEEPSDLETRLDVLLDAMLKSPATVIAVTSEVGCGIEPESPAAKRFRDEAGRLNQRCAAIAGEVYWMVFGCPLRVK